MNLINPNLIDTINSNSRSNEITSLPQWAQDEKLYLCDPPIDSKPSKAKATDTKNNKRLFWRSIVNIK
jgi:hypothetical protein